MIHLYTIGFTKKSAEEFFTKLRDAGVKRVLDIRLYNASQLAGYTKKDDLAYFLRAIGGMEYVHNTDFSPTKELFDGLKKQKGEWSVYEKGFIKLITKRKIEDIYPKKFFDGACLLCSEDKPTHCHRRLVAEYLAKKWGDVEIRHIV